MADSTRAMRRAIYERDVEPAFKNRMLTEIEPGDVRALCQLVKDRGAPATANQIERAYGPILPEARRADRPDAVYEIGVVKSSPLASRKRV